MNNTKINIVIIIKQINEDIYNIYNQLIKNYPFTIISDKPTYLVTKYPNIFYYSSKITMEKGYKNLTSFKKCTAWDKAIRHISENNNYDYYWILEDDLFIDNNFESFISKYDLDNADYLYSGWFKTKKEMKTWFHWSKAKKYFSNDIIAASLNQFCRISSNLLNSINDFKKEHGRLIFHEILVASLVRQNNLPMKSIADKTTFISAIEYRKHLNTREKLEYYKKRNKNIVHPIKKWYRHLDLIHVVE